MGREQAVEAGGYTVAYRSLLEGALVLVLLLPVAGTQVCVQPLVRPNVVLSLLVSGQDLYHE